MNQILMCVADNVIFNVMYVNDIHILICTMIYSYSIFYLY